MDAAEVEIEAELRGYFFGPDGRPVAPERVVEIGLELADRNQNSLLVPILTKVMLESLRASLSPVPEEGTDPCLTDL